MHKPIPNPYKTLGIDDLSDIETIKAAYRQLAMRYHPDRNPTPEAGEKMREINTAWDSLKTPESKRNIDAQIKPKASQPSDDGYFKAEWFNKYNDGSSPFSNNFANMQMQKAIKLNNLKQQKAALLRQMTQVDLEIQMLEKETR